MSYNTTCNVNVLKVVDLRLKTDNNIPPGLNSTLFTGPQNVYGSPLTWDYILTSADLSTLILQQSSIISTNTYLLTTTLSSSVSTVRFSYSTISSYLQSSYTYLNTKYVGDFPVLIDGTSNLYLTVSTKATSTIKNLSVGKVLTTSTAIGSALSSYTTNASTTNFNNLLLYSTLSYYQTISTFINTQTYSTGQYSTLLTSTLLARWESTILSECNQFIAQSNQETLSKLLFTSLFYSLSTDPVTNPLLQSFSTQLGIQTDNQVSTLNYGISSLKDAYTKQFSTMSSFVNRGIPDAVNLAFSSFTSTTNKTFVSYSTSIGTAQYAADSAYTIITNCNNYLSTTLSSMIDYQYDNLAYLSTEIGTPLLYRPQTFYQIDILLNNSSLSSVRFNQSNNTTVLSNNLLTLLSNTFSTSKVQLSTLYQQELSNSYYDILVDARKIFNTTFTSSDFSTLNSQIYQYLNFQSTISNIDIANFSNTPWYPIFVSTNSNIINAFSTKQGIYNTLLNSTYWQQYTGVVTSEQLAICNTAIKIFSTDSRPDTVSTIATVYYLSSLSPSIIFPFASFNPFNSNIVLSTFSSILYFSTNSGLFLSSVPFYSSTFTQNLSSLSTQFYYPQIYDSTVTCNFVKNIFNNLNTQFFSYTSTTKLNLITYTFKEYRNDSEEVLRTFNDAEAYQSTTAGNLSNQIINGPFGDMYYSNYSTISMGNWLSTTTILKSTQIGIFNTSTISINYIFHFRSLSTNYTSSLSTANAYYTTWNSSLKSTYVFNSGLQTSNYIIHLSTTLGNYAESYSTISTIFDDRTFLMNSTFSTGVTNLSTSFGESVSTMYGLYNSTYSTNISNYSTQSFYLVCNYNAAFSTQSTNYFVTISSLSSYNIYTNIIQNSNFSVGTSILSTNYLNSNSTISTIYFNTYWGSVSNFTSSISTAQSNFSVAIQQIDANAIVAASTLSSVFILASNNISTVFYSSMYITSTNFSSYSAYTSFSYSSGISTISSSLYQSSNALYSNLYASLSIGYSNFSTNLFNISSMYVSSVSTQSGNFSTSCNALMSSLSANLLLYSTINLILYNLASTQYVSTIYQASTLLLTAITENQSTYAGYTSNLQTLASSVSYNLSSMYISSILQLSNDYINSFNNNSSFFTSTYSSMISNFNVNLSTGSYIYSTSFSTVNGERIANTGTSGFNLSSFTLVMSTIYYGYYSTLVSNHSSAAQHYSTMIATSYSTNATNLSSFNSTISTIYYGYISTSISNHSTYTQEISTLYGLSLSTARTNLSTAVSTVSTIYNTDYKTLVFGYSTSIQDYSTLVGVYLSTDYNYLSTNISTLSSLYYQWHSTTVSNYSTNVCNLSSVYYSTLSSLADYLSTNFSTISSIYYGNFSTLVSNYSTAIQNYSTYVGTELSTNTYNLSTAVSTISTIYYSNYSTVVANYSTTINSSCNIYKDLFSSAQGNYSSYISTISGLTSPNLTSLASNYSTNLQNLSTLLYYWSTAVGSCNAESGVAISTLASNAMANASTMFGQSNSTLVGYYCNNLTSYNYYYSTATSTISTQVYYNTSTLSGLYSTLISLNSTNAGVGFSTNTYNLSTSFSTISTLYQSSLVSLYSNYSTLTCNYSIMVGSNLSTNLNNLSTSFSTISTMYQSSLVSLYSNYSSYTVNYSVMVGSNLSTNLNNLSTSFSTISTMYQSSLVSLHSNYSSYTVNYSVIVGSNLSTNLNNLSTSFSTISTIYQSSLVSLHSNYSSYTVNYSIMVGSNLSTNLNNLSTSFSTISTMYQSSLVSLYSNYSSYTVNYSVMVGSNLSTNLNNLSTSFSTISTIYQSSLVSLYSNYSSYTVNYSVMVGSNLSTNLNNLSTSHSTISTIYQYELRSTINHYSTSINQYSTLLGNFESNNTKNYSTIYPAISTIYYSSYSSLALFYSTVDARLSTISENSNSTLEALSNRFDSTFSSFFVNQYSTLLGNYSANIYLISTVASTSIVTTIANFSTAYSNLSSIYISKYLDLQNNYSTAQSTISSYFISNQSTIISIYSTNYARNASNYSTSLIRLNSIYSTIESRISTVYASNLSSIYINYSTFASNSSNHLDSNISVLTRNHSVAIVVLSPIISTNVVVATAGIIISTYFSIFPAQEFINTNNLFLTLLSNYNASTQVLSTALYSTISTNYKLTLSSISTDFGKYVQSFSSGIITLSTVYLANVAYEIGNDSDEISTILNETKFQQLTRTEDVVLQTYSSYYLTLSTVFGYGLTQINNVMLSNDILTTNNIFNYGNSTSIDTIRVTDTLSTSPFLVKMYNRTGLNSLLYIKSSHNQVTSGKIYINALNSTTSQTNLISFTSTTQSTIRLSNISTSTIPELSTIFFTSTIPVVSPAVVNSFLSTVNFLSTVSGTPTAFSTVSSIGLTFTSNILTVSTINFFSTLVSPLNIFYSIIVASQTFSTLSTIVLSTNFVTATRASTVTSTQFFSSPIFVFSTTSNSTINLGFFSNTVTTYQNELGNTMSTFYLDLFMYQNFYVNINTMSNANPTIETYINVCNLPPNVQSGEIFIDIRRASQNELVAKRFLSFTNVVSTYRKNITNSVGLIKVKYTSMYGNTIITSFQNFSETPIFQGAVSLAAVPSQTVLTVNTGDVYNYWCNAATQPAGYTFPVAIQSNQNTGTGEYSLSGLAIDESYNIYATDINSNMIWILSNGSNTLAPYVSTIQDAYTLCIDSNRNLYTPSLTQNKIYKIDQFKSTFTLTNQISSPLGITLDYAHSNLFIASAKDHNIYRLNLSTLSTSFYMGGGNASPSHADGNATTARFGTIFGMATDIQGNLYVADSDTNTIRSIKISISTSVTIAGTPNTPGSADGINAVARFNAPKGLVTDNLGNLFINDYLNFTFRTLSLQNNQVSSIAGNKNIRGVQDGYLSTATFAQPFGLAIDNTATNFYVADIQSVRRINFDIGSFTGLTPANVLAINTNEASNRYVITLAGSNTVGFPTNTFGLAYDGTNFYLGTSSNSGNNILIYNQSAGLLSTFVTLSTQAYNITADINSNLLVTDNLSTIYFISTSGGNALAPTIISSGFTKPQGITVDRYLSTSVYFTTAGQIYKLANYTTTPTFTLVAGAATNGSADGTGALATFSQTMPGISAWNGIVYVSDQGNSIIRQIDSVTGIVKTIAGSVGSSGFANGIGTATQFSNAIGVAAISNFSTGIDVYIADSGNSVIRKINPKTGIVGTIAGNDKVIGNVDGYAFTSYFTAPQTLIADTPKNLYTIDNISQKSAQIASSNITITDNSASANGPLITDYGPNSLVNILDGTYQNYYNRIFQNYSSGFQTSYNFTVSFTPSIQFNYTGSAQTWTCPAGVTSISITMSGGGGGGGFWFSPIGSGGNGGLLQGTLPVTPGTTYYIVSGGGGGGATSSTAGAGGYGGGGNGNNSGYPGGGGGGRSAISQFLEVRITSATSTGTFVTYTTNGAHGLGEDYLIIISGLSPAGYNGAFRILEVTSTTIKVLNSTTATLSGTGTILWEIITVGGGGGAGGANGSAGGAGGGLTGGDGGNPGHGGGQFSGGAAFSGAGEAGTVLQGGNATGQNAGGGGGGYYGGGAGIGGGGGSAYNDDFFVGTTIQGGGVIGGQGNNPAASGQNGYVNIQYIIAGGVKVNSITIYSAAVGDTVHTPQLIYAYDQNFNLLGSVSYPTWSIDRVRNLQYYVLDLTTPLTSGNMTLIFYKYSQYQMYLTQLLFFNAGSASSQIRAIYFDNSYASAPVYASLSTLLIQMRNLSTTSFISFSTNRLNSTIASGIFSNTTIAFASTANAYFTACNAGYSALKTTYVATALNAYNINTLYDASMNIINPVITTNFNFINSQNLSTFVLTSTSFSSLINTNASYNFNSLNIIFTNVSSNYQRVLSLTSTNVNQYSNQISSLFGLERSYSTIMDSYLVIASNAATSALVSASNAQSGSEITSNFFFTGSDQYFTVPSGVRSLFVSLYGAAGQYGFTGGGNGPEIDTQGGFVSGTLVVSPGDQYIVVVGGQNANYDWNYGGGGAGENPYGGAGGGRSALQYISGSSGYPTYVDIVTAGGGGGDGYYQYGGFGGASVGQSGTSPYGGAPTGGTQFSGGSGGYLFGYNGYSGGYYYQDYYNTSGQARYYGGQGYIQAGGGGGGFYGGGGGVYYYQGGAGGSSYINYLTGTIINTQGGGSKGQGHGRITLTYTVITANPAFGTITFNGSNLNIISNTNSVQYANNYNGSATSGFGATINWNGNPNTTVYVKVIQWYPSGTPTVSSDPGTDPASIIITATGLDTGTGVSTGTGTSTGTGASTGTGTGTGTGYVYASLAPNAVSVDSVDILRPRAIVTNTLLTFTPTYNYLTQYYSTSINLTSNYTSITVNTTNSGTKGNSVVYTVQLNSDTINAAAITAPTFIAKQIMNTATERSYSGSADSGITISTFFNNATYIYDTNGATMGTYGTNYTISSIIEVSDPSNAYSVRDPFDYGVNIFKTTSSNVVCPATMTINGFYDKHDGAGFSTIFGITVNMSQTFTSAGFYGYKASLSYSNTPTEGATFTDTLMNFTPGSNVAGLGSDSSIYYYTGLATSAMDSSNVTLTSITLNQTAINNGFTTTTSNISFSSSSLGSKTGTATLAGTYSGSGGLNPPSASFSIAISLQETCAASINTSASYSNNASASGSTFTDNINLASASALFQYNFSRGAIPTYSVTGISLDGTATTNGFTTTGTSIAFSKIVTSTQSNSGTATVTGTYDKQGGAGNVTAFTLTLSLLEVCTVSAKTMNTNTETFTKAAQTTKTTFDIFNSTYFRYTDNSVVANLQITAVSFTNPSDQSIWTWSGSAGTYSGANLASFGAIELTYGGLSGHTRENQVSVDDSESDTVNPYAAPGGGGGGGTGCGGGGTGSVINTFTVTAVVTGTYDDSVNITPYVAFSKSFNLTANF